MIQTQQRIEYGSGFSPRTALTKYGERIFRATRKLVPGQQFKHQTAEEMKSEALEAAVYYEEEIKPHWNRISAMPVREIMAATDADQVGTLAGVLVLQESLPLFKYEFPVLASFYSDFSATPGRYKQTEDTRILITPAVQSYDPTSGDDGRPKGWATVRAVQAKDVPITLDEHIGVPIVFGQDTLASTMRRLFR